MTDANRACVPMRNCVDVGGMCFLREYNAWIHPLSVAVSNVFYLVVIYLLRAWMSSRVACKCTWWMRLYNVSQIVLCGAMTMGLTHGWEGGWIFSPFCSNTEKWVLIHFFSKYVDMLDTVFMALRKKNDQISFLHLYHHFTVGFFWAIVLRAGVGNGVIAFGAWLNSLVHVVMYAHYFATSFGIHNPFKKYITSFQILQFFLNIALSCAGVVFKTSTPRHLLLCIIYCVSLIVPFSRFYHDDRIAEKKLKPVRD